MVGRAVSIQRAIGLVAIGMALLGIGNPAAAGNIYTGDSTGSYHSSFCPVLQRELAASGFQYDCRPTNGTLDNMERIATEPAAIGYGQLDVLALGARFYGGSDAFVRIRSDDVRECLFAVTRNTNLESYGDMAVNARRLRFVLPPVNSGSATTFRFLQAIDTELAAAGKIVHAADTEEAIRIALSSDDTVAIFVQFPDPDNSRFKLIERLGGRFVPIIDKTILDQRLGQSQIYFPQETQVANHGWLQRGPNVVTACTPLVVFTGKTAKIASPRAGDEQQQVISLVAELTPDRLLPKQSLFARVLKRTRELTGESAEQMLALSAAARAKAKPLLDQAKQAADKAVEASRPSLDKAREIGADTYEKAQEGAKELLAPSPSRE